MTQNELLIGTIDITYIDLFTVCILLRTCVLKHKHTSTSRSIISYNNSFTCMVHGSPTPPENHDPPFDPEDGLMGLFTGRSLSFRESSSRVLGENAPSLKKIGSLVSASASASLRLFCTQTPNLSGLVAVENMEFQAVLLSASGQKRREKMEKHMKTYDNYVWHRRLEELDSDSLKSCFSFALEMFFSIFSDSR